MGIKQKVASYEKICRWKIGLIGQTNGSKVLPLSGDANQTLLKTNFCLHVEYYVTSRSFSNDMIG